MKCDELKVSCYTTRSYNTIKAYDKKEVDEAIAELKQNLHDIDNQWNEQCKEITQLKAENRRLLRELWLTRGAVHKANRKAMYGLLQAYPLWEGRPAGLEVHKSIHRYDGYERKCLKKAEEYK